MRTPVDIRIRPRMKVQASVSIHLKALEKIKVPILMCVEGCSNLTKGLIVDLLDNKREDDGQYQEKL